MERISLHAALRVRQRLRVKGLRDAQALLSQMWISGREPCADEYSWFGTDKRQGFEYRIAVRQNRVYLIVFGQDCRQFVTVLIRRQQW